MGSIFKRPPLPAATDSDAGHAPARSHDDVAAGLSDDGETTITLNSSYTIPPTGQPVRIPTKKGRSSRHDREDSQASLLIELYDQKSRGPGRPSARVRVSSGGKVLKDTVVGKAKKTSRSRQYPTAGRYQRYSWEPEEMTVNDSAQRGITGDTAHDVTEEAVDNTRYMPNDSSVSDMPADNMQEPLHFKTPTRGKTSSGVDERRSSTSTKDKHSDLSHRRSRSLSRERQERIQRKAAEKVRAIEGSPEDSTRRRTRTSRDRSGGKVLIEGDRHNRSRRSSKTHSSRNSAEYSAALGSDSHLHPRDAESNLSHSNASQLSKSSLANNPRLLQTVEDAIRRMILPEIAEIKRKQSVRDGPSSRSARDSYRTEDTEDQDLAASSRAKDGETRVRRVRKSSRDVTDEARSSRRTSATSRDATKKVSSRHSSRESEGLTAAALKDHDKRAKERELHEERRERRKKRSQSRSDDRSNSIAQTEDEYYDKSSVPAMPLQSVEESDMTRDSILSAATNDTYSDQTRSTDQQDTPRNKAVEATPREVLLPESRSSTRTPRGTIGRSTTPASRNTASPVTSRSARQLKNQSSDGLISTKARHAALSAAGLGGAAGALYGLHRNNADRSRSRQSQKTEDSLRDVSPVQSETNSMRSEPDPGPPSPPEEHGDSSMSPVHEGSRGIQQAVELESPHISGRDIAIKQPQLDVTRRTDGRRVSGPRDFPGIPFNGNNARQSTARDFNGKRDSALTEFSANDNIDSPTGESFVEQRVKQVAAQPQVYSNAHFVESETGSLIEHSHLSSVQSAAQTPAQSFDKQSFKARQLAGDGTRDDSVMLNEEANASQDRWKHLKETARVLSNSKESLDNSPTSARNMRREESVSMGKSGIPDPNDPMPEIGYGHNDDAVIESGLRDQTSSILEGPLGNEYENRDHWPYEPTPELRKASNWSENDRDDRHNGTSNVALLGAAAGLGIGTGTAAVDTRNMQQDGHGRSVRSQSSASRDTDYGQHGYQSRGKAFSPSYGKDEGYISAVQARSPDNLTPLSFSKPPPTLFGSKDRGYDATPVGEDPFIEQDKRSRHISNNSHGMNTGYYDAATGKGINNIQNADVMALMNHLHVRDGQRSARDNELIFTLIKSATETRQNFDSVKKMIETQNSASLKNQDKNTESLMARIMAGPKPQILGSPRTPLARSVDDTPAKKQNIFKRAIKGLGSKSTNDVSEIQAMLYQVLDEIELLKASQSNVTQPASVTAPSMNDNVARGSVDTMQRLQQPGDPGYEPEGQAGTGSTPSHSGYFSPATRKAVPQSHPGLGPSNRVSNHNKHMSTNRVSTVFEEDGEIDDDGNRSMTPTQESQRQRSISYDTPRQAVGAVQNLDDSPSAAPDSAERRFRLSNKTLSFPRVSRWSKTTEDSSTDHRFSTDTKGQAGRPYSEAFWQESQSGEAVNAIPGADGEPWEMHDDDRLRSSGSLAREEGGRGMTPEQPSVSRSAENRLSQESAADPKYNNFKHASLPLQHPQPRQGPTGRHQNRLEDEADVYDDPDVVSMYGGTSDGGESFIDQELFGSVPALARLPGGFSATRRSSSGQTAQVQRAMASPPTTQSDPNSPPAAYGSATRIQPGPSGLAPAASSVPINRGPALPPKIALTQPTPTHQAVQSYTQEADSPAHDRDLHSQTPSSIVTSSLDSLEHEDDIPSPSYPLNATLRRRSPYEPGGPLAPIEERYSMEGDRSSLAYSLSQRSRRHSMDVPWERESGSRGHSRQTSALEGQVQAQGQAQYAYGYGPGQGQLAQVVEGDERGGATTPSRSPRPALGADVRGGEVRRLTGPRDMPGQGGLAGAGVRRKPVAAESVY